MGTLDAVQVLAGVSQLLPKSRENYLNRCMDQERLRRESTSQKEMDKVGLGLRALCRPRGRVSPPDLIPSLCLLGGDQDEEGGREPAALGGKIQLSPRRL